MSHRSNWLLNCVTRFCSKVFKKIEIPKNWNWKIIKIFFHKNWWFSVDQIIKFFQQNCLKNKKQNYYCKNVWKSLCHKTEKNINWFIFHNFLSELSLNKLSINDVTLLSPSSLSDFDHKIIKPSPQRCKEAKCVTSFMEYSYVK